MKHKKRGLALLLMLTLALLCGCEGTVSERPMEDISALTIEPGADEPTADAFAYRPQVSVFRDDDAPSFENDNSAEGLQEEDWYDENFEDDSSADTFESDDGKQ